MNGRIPRRFVGLALSVVTTLALCAGCLGTESEATSCSKVGSEIEKERQRLQACTTDSDCGASESKGTCGCTRAIPVRADADTTRYRALVDRAIECDLPFGGTCDCPKTDGFRCENSACSWVYVTP